ncbi:hypothetical protein ACL43R_09790 [Lactococcus formosensis]|uniref:hypothetical protein n=1 Tax=Lactococcus formosensis TaxID=1281486 RepID=UPI0039F6A71B
MIDIKKHTVTEGKTTYDVCIYTDLNKLPHKFIQGVKLTKEEVLKIIDTYKPSPTILSQRIYNNLLGIKEN